MVYTGEDTLILSRWRWNKKLLVAPNNGHWEITVISVNEPTLYLTVIEITVVSVIWLTHSHVTLWSTCRYYEQVPGNVIVPPLPLRAQTQPWVYRAMSGMDRIISGENTLWGNTDILQQWWQANIYCDTWKYICSNTSRANVVKWTTLSLLHRSFTVRTLSALQSCVWQLLLWL